MRFIFHTIIVWLMLLTVPVQGFAAATMMTCEPIAASAPASMQPHHHHHAQMSVDGEHTQHHHQQSNNHHAAGKCGFCAACCLGAAMTPPAALVFPKVGFDSEHIVALDAFPTSIIPDYPDRPPQAARV
jgi:hypothetical protein